MPNITIDSLTWDRIHLCQLNLSQPSHLSVCLPRPNQWMTYFLAWPTFDNTEGMVIFKQKKTSGKQPKLISLRLTLPFTLQRWNLVFNRPQKASKYRTLSWNNENTIYANNTKNMPLYAKTNDKLYFSKVSRIVKHGAERSQMPLPLMTSYRYIPPKCQNKPFNIILTYFPALLELVSFQIYMIIVFLTFMCIWKYQVNRMS